VIGNSEFHGAFDKIKLPIFNKFRDDSTENILSKPEKKMGYGISLSDSTSAIKVTMEFSVNINI